MLSCWSHWTRTSSKGSLKLRLRQPGWESAPPSQTPLNSSGRKGSLSPLAWGRAPIWKGFKSFGGGVHNWETGGTWDWQADQCSGCSHAVVLLACCGKKGAELNGEALHLPVNLCSYSHLWLCPIICYEEGLNKTPCVCANCSCFNPHTPSGLK